MRLKDSRGIAKTKRHLLIGISAERPHKCSLFLLLGGNKNLGGIEVPIKKVIEAYLANLSGLWFKKNKEKWSFLVVEFNFV